MSNKRNFKTDRPKVPPTEVLSSEGNVYNDPTSEQATDSLKSEKNPENQEHAGKDKNNFFTKIFKKP